MLFACTSQSCGNVADWLAWAAPEECLLRLEVGEPPLPLLCCLLCCRRSGPALSQPGCQVPGPATPSCLESWECSGRGVQK